MNIKQPQIIDGLLVDDFTDMGNIDSFVCEYTALTSLEGCPRNVATIFNIYNNLNLKTLEYAPLNVGMIVDIQFTSISSLQGIGRDYFQSIGREILLNNEIDSNILGLLKVKDLKKV